MGVRIRLRKGRHLPDEGVGYINFLPVAAPRSAIPAIVEMYFSTNIVIYAHYEQSTVSTNDWLVGV